MIHLLMKFDGDKPVFTGLAFAKGTTAASVAENRNKAKEGFHYVLAAPIDTAADEDGHEDLDEGYENVFLVIATNTNEEVVFAVYSDEAAARLLVESRRAYHDTIQYVVRPTRVHYVHPPGDDMAPNLVAA